MPCSVTFSQRLPKSSDLGRSIPCSIACAEDILDLYATENGYSKLEDLDLAAMLRVADKSWYDMRSFAYLPTRDRQCVREMFLE